MSQGKRVRRSPAILLGALALIASVAGTAVAGSGPEASTSASANATAKKALKVAKATSKKEGQKGDTGTNGVDGADGEDGTARAYGYFDGGVLSKSKNIDSAIPGGPGVVCVTPSAGSGIDPSTTPMVATPDGDTPLPSTSIAHVTVSVSNSICPPSDFAVKTSVYIGDDTDDDGGIADGPGDLLDTGMPVGFHFMVP